MTRTTRSSRRAGLTGLGAVVLTAVLPVAAPGTLPAAQAGDGTVRVGTNGKCLDADLNTLSRDGGVAQLWDCNGQSQQSWTFGSDGSLRVANGGKCLDADLNNISRDGARVQLWTCNGSSQQRWTRYTDGSLRIGTNGKCLDADAGNIQNNGAKVQLWTCNSTGQQRWAAPPPGGSSGGSTSLAARIVADARDEAFTERGGYNCNPYTYATGYRTGGCPSGLSSLEWCSDFARVLWGRNGADTGGLTAGAVSFRTAAEQRGTWRAGWSASPRPGDAMVYGGKGHVALVLEVASPRRVLIAEGNAGRSTDRIVHVWVDPATDTGNGGRVVGYASPRPRR